MPSCLVPSCPVPSCPGVQLSWCPVVLVSSCPGAQLSWCLVVLVPSCLVPSCPVPSCPGAQLSYILSYHPARFCLSRKHGLATFVHERLKWILIDQSPPTSEIEWVCVDVDNYKIVNVYKPPPTRI